MPQTPQTAIGALLLAGSLLLGGCAPWAFGPATTTAMASRASLVLTPRITAGRRAQAVVPQLTLEAVDHVRIQLTRVIPGGEDAVRDADGPLALRVPRADLDRPIVLSQLHPHERYKIRAWAYKAPDETDDNLISDESAMEVEVGSDDRPTVSPLLIQLKATPFNGKATLPSIEIRPGGYTYDESESLTLPQVEFVNTPDALSWLAPDGDRMGPTTAEPDGLPDAHFRLALDLPPDVTIREIAIIADGGDGFWDDAESWTTWDYGDEQHRLLGVVHQGQLVNSAFVPRLGSFSGPVEFDLYAHDGFTRGKRYWFQVVLSNAQAFWDGIVIPAQEEASTHE